LPFSLQEHLNFFTRLNVSKKATTSTAPLVRVFVDSTVFLWLKIDQAHTLTLFFYFFTLFSILTKDDYNNLEQRLFVLVNDMVLNFTKYSSLITDAAKFTTANDNYLVRYMEAKSVLDNIADWQTQTLLAKTTSAATSTVTPTSVAPPISVAT
jgi:hypothetical protein